MCLMSKLVLSARGTVVTRLILACSEWASGSCWIADMNWVSCTIVCVVQGCMSSRKSVSHLWSHTSAQNRMCLLCVQFECNPLGWKYCTLVAQLLEENTSLTRGCHWHAWAHRPVWSAIKHSCIHLPLPLPFSFSLSTEPPPTVPRQRRQSTDHGAVVAAVVVAILIFGVAVAIGVVALLLLARCVDHDITRRGWWWWW